MREVVVGQVYKHFKGKMYKVLNIGYSADNLEKMVIYQALYDDNKIWVRNYDEFNSYVDKDKYPNITQKYRFEEVC